MKDVETIRPPELLIAAVLPRADVRDRLVGAESIEAIAPGGTVGTSSPRRAAQVRHIRPDLQIAMFRGNVATRLARLEAGEADATLLAAAGLDRLGHGDIGLPISADRMLPAPAQGVVGIETLSAREELRAILAAANDAGSLACVQAERALLVALGGTCHSPVAALAERDGDRLCLRAEILLPDGSERQGGSRLFSSGDMQAPADLAAELLGSASPALRALFGA
jgi:hydroxymethylbilane synthase